MINLEYMMIYSYVIFSDMQIPIGKFESNEIEIWGGLSGRHPNILELYGAMKYRQSGTVIIFMEYMSGMHNFFVLCICNFDFSTGSPDFIVLI